MRTTHSISRLFGPTCLILLVTLAGCATSDTTATTDVTSGGTAPETTAGTDETLIPEGDLSFNLGTSSALEFFNLPGAITAERVNEAGWQVEIVQHAQTQLNTQSLAQGHVQWSVTRHVEPLRVFAEGQENIRYIYENSGLDYGIVIPSDLSCEDMDGKRFGIHGEASTASLLAVNYLENECGAELDILVIPGGENRIVALQNGELDGTSVAFTDYLLLDRELPGEYQLLDTGQTFAVAGAGWWGNFDWVEANHDVGVAWVAENLKTHRMIRDDPDLYLDAYERLIGTDTYAGMEETIFELFLEYGTWPVNGGDATAMEASIPVYAGFGELDPALEQRVNEMVNTDILEEALEIVGRVDGER